MALAHVSDGDPHVAAHNEERDAINDLQDDIPTLVAKPSAPQEGQILLYKSGEWTKSDTRMFEGSGSPEGNLAAPVGSRYVAIGGSSGAVEWLKVTGTGNTGWVALLADTGFRNISAQIATRSSGTVQSAYLRRVGDVVDFYLDMTMPNNEASPYLLWTLPVGFRPPVARYGALQDNNENAANTTSVGSNGEINLYSPHATKRDRWNGVWTTRDAWPSSLPGSVLS